MRKNLIAIGALTLLTVSPALADPASHVIGDDRPVSSATDSVVSRGEATFTLRLAHTPRGSAPAVARADVGTIGDDEPVSRVTDARR